MKLWLPQPSDGSQPAVGVIGAQRLIPSHLFFLNSVTVAEVEVRDRQNEPWTFKGGGYVSSLSIFMLPVCQALGVSQCTRSSCPCGVCIS